MADTISSDRRSKIMSHIKSKDTSIEMMVRRRLFAMGYRYRVNYKALPGKPDIVSVSYTHLLPGLPGGG